MEHYKEMMLELTNDCQACCTMCLHKVSKRKVVHMDLDLLRKIINEVEVKDMATKDNPLGICGVGDPLLHPEFDKALGIIQRVPFGLGSNCMALEEDKIKSIISHGFNDMTLSLDAVTPEVYERMRPGLSYEDVMTNALFFLRELKKVKKPTWRNVFIQMLYTKVNHHELEEFIDRWYSYTELIPNTKIFIKPVYHWPGNETFHITYPSPSLPKEVKGLPNILYGPFHVPAKFRDTCELFDRFIQIQSDGTYSPCCMNVEDDYKIGNVKNENIEDLYNSLEMTKYRGLFKERRFEEIPFCRRCS